MVVGFVAVFGPGVFAQDRPVGSDRRNAAPQPVSLGLVVDNSGSFRMIFDRVVSATNTIIEDLREGDESFLVTFVDTPKIVMRQEMTAKPQELRDSAENMFVEGGATAILDAVVFASKYLATQGAPGDTRSRVLVLITDGDERGSAASIDDAVKAAKDAGARIFVLGLFDEKFYSKIPDRLIKDTGGAKFVPKAPKDIPAAVASLLSAVRAK
jgi:Mg-chelatase subunit ChlD